MNLSKSFTIITDNPDPICRFIVEDLNRSASTYRAEGIYTHQDHTVIMTTMGRQQGSRLQRVIREADPHAFVVITNTSQVIGKGFRAETDPIRPSSGWKYCTGLCGISMNRLSVRRAGFLRPVTYFMQKSVECGGKRSFSSWKRFITPLYIVV